MAPLCVLKRWDRPLGLFKSTEGGRAASTPCSPHPHSRMEVAAIKAGGAGAGCWFNVTPKKEGAVAAGSDCSLPLCVAGAAEGPNPPSEGWACGHPRALGTPGQRGRQLHQGRTKGALGPRQLPPRCRLPACFRAAPLPKVTLLPARQKRRCYILAEAVPEFSH